MKEENINEVDFFVAATEVDEDNVMTCLQAHSIGAKQCLTLIHREDYADAITGFSERVGIMAAVSPRKATRQDLMRFVTSDRYHLVKRLEEELARNEKVLPAAALKEFREALEIYRELDKRAK